MGYWYIDFGDGTGYHRVSKQQFDLHAFIFSMPKKLGELADKLDALAETMERCRP